MIVGTGDRSVSRLASQLDATWKKLHPDPTQVKVKPASPTVIPNSRPSRPELQSRHLPRPKFSRVFCPSLHQQRLFSISILAVRSRRSGFLIRSRTSSSMRLRFLKTMRLQQSRTLPILQCFSLLGTSMPQHPCPDLAEAVAVQSQNQVGEKRMTRMNAPMLADAY